MTIVEGPVPVDGHDWYRMTDHGWAIADYLRVDAPLPVRLTDLAPEPAPVAAPAPEPAAAQPATGRAPTRRTALVQGAEPCVNARREPSRSAEPLACHADGTRLTVAEGPIESDGRRWIRLEEGGWAAADYFSIDPAVEAAPAPRPEPVPSPAVAPPAAQAPARSTGTTAVVTVETAPCANVRREPAIDAEVVACLPDGTRAAVAEGPAESGGRRWYQLQGHGWVAAEILSIETIVPAATPSAPAPAESPAPPTPTSGHPAGDALSPGPAVVRGADPCVNARQEPSLGAGAVACLPNGSKVTIVGGPESADGHRWYRLAGLGWAVEDYLSPEG